ncbi:subtilisin-like protease SBT1.6 [Ananas comosus]|uniref:Subtilisin-like protease SBT1.2 n=1 Tax=Ananas comosus TaxID=4615 RepID=A0A199W8Q9_ANACO|nr:subtilisin-like protease SBT1.6 [Ananas comosus]OAY85852.1 Subtilisin-like protease SBT1.2 [Ananas comosus]
MENPNHKHLLLLTSLLLISHSDLILTHTQLLPIVRCSGHGADRDVYIVHVKHPNTTHLLAAADRETYYKTFLPPTAAAGGEQRLMYSYTHAISGFAARLSEAEVEAMASREGFVRAHRDKQYQLHTTHSPGFLDLQPDHCFWKESNFGAGVIIGVLDTGVTPFHPSFSDAGMALPPSKWKGACDFDTRFCNNKLIGARGFSRGCRDAPLDLDGHGTHTASTAAGGFVNGASVLGQAKGSAAGLAPRAQLAVYKVCDKACFGSDVLAGIDQAIADGVDVLSISFGARSAPFYDDAVAIGTMAAAAWGIFVSTSAGNEGPREGSVENDAPWVLTVGASTIDRTVRSTVKLGNGQQIYGESAYQPGNFPATQLPIAYPGARGISRAKTCSDGSLDGVNVRGKIVLCETGGANTSVEKGAIVRRAGGVGMIVMNGPTEMYTPEARAHVLPAAHVSYADAVKLKAYMKMAPTPTAAISFAGTLYGTPQAAPAVAAFSGRGPSAANNGVLKPDIIGPGVNIVAAWPKSVGASSNPTNDESIATFNMISGTSPAAAHLAGIAALLKASHPDWSPAAIKSAMMTSADTLDRSGNLISDEGLQPAQYLATGAGHVNPTKADDPGLVYDLWFSDYIAYLCGLGYTDRQVTSIARTGVECASVAAIAAEELNYPTIVVAIGANAQKTVTRTVRNVGEPGEAYAAAVDAPEGVAVSVFPDRLEFSGANETAVFDVYFTTGDDVEGRTGAVAEGQLRWVSNKHTVRSSISITFI